MINNNRGNNNSSNNRRRGRGNRPQGGGGQPQNRIDSRARGNAPQLLEKYRKLAQDAHQNGDRVAAETYLQYADHYFRVLADARVRQEEPRARRDERWQEGGDEADDSGDFNVESDFPSFEQPGYGRQREDRARDDRPREDRPREDRQREDRPRGDRQDRAPRPDRAERPERAPRETADDANGVAADGAGADQPAAANPYEPPENPFLRENRGTRGLRPRREGRGENRTDAGSAAPRSEPREERQPRRHAGDEAPVGLDPASLPPAISASRSEPVAASAADVEVEAETKPRRRAPRRKPGADEAGEALESVS